MIKLKQILIEAEMIESKINEESVLNALKKSWGADICPEDFRKYWSSENPAFGCCGPTSYVVSKLLGAKIVQSDVIHHSWNELNGKYIDFSESQFQPGMIEKYIKLFPNDITPDVMEKLNLKKSSDGYYIYDVSKLKPVVDTTFETAEDCFNDSRTDEDSKKRCLLLLNKVKRILYIKK